MIVEFTRYVGDRTILVLTFGADGWFTNICLVVSLQRWECSSETPMARPSNFIEVWNVLYKQFTGASGNFSPPVRDGILHQGYRYVELRISDSRSHMVLSRGP